MNKNLSKEIVKHIFANFGIIPSDFVNQDNLLSLISKEYLLDDTISFENENGNLLKNKIWGCQLSTNLQELKILVGDLSQDIYVKEYCMIIQLKDSPVYALYYSYSIHDILDNESVIAFSLDKQKWIECETYLQATFLAGMQQVKDIGFAWNKCSDYKSQHKAMINFIKYYSAMYEELNEG
ncbi:hypothetical protein UFOVP1290_540 [uncultured Caudovirales phage]|uniref:Uncharacterized protein n=1 Tax=uncultured Caudovirales phage TaxID=2100421 RepID=A0A6J5RHR6_9CAUD|nr:hypothetical protein UFOVP1290_540 [uncultured Caudovirales phage]